MRLFPHESSKQEQGPKMEMKPPPAQPQGENPNNDEMYITQQRVVLEQGKASLAIRNWCGVAESGVGGRGMGRKQSWVREGGGGERNMTKKRKKKKK